MTLSLRPTSLDAPIGQDSDGEFGEIIGDERMPTPYDQLSDRQLRGEVESLLDRLNKRERDILRFRYGLRGVPVETLETVGKRFKITRERVRQIQNAAIVKLRNMMEKMDQPKPRAKRERSPA